MIKADNIESECAWLLAGGNKLCIIESAAHT